MTETPIGDRLDAELSHKTRVDHVSSGWRRWKAACECGWWRLALGTKAAEELGREHVQRVTS